MYSAMAISLPLYRRNIKVLARPDYVKLQDPVPHACVTVSASGPLPDTRQVPCLSMRPSSTPG
jgi:hypothetical protein